MSTNHIARARTLQEGDEPIRGLPAIGTSLIRLTNATFGYRGHKALAHVDLDIAAGSAVALIGPNGAGKSTLLKGLLRVLAPISGRVEGSPRTGYLPQTLRIDPDFPISVRQAVAMGCYHHGGWLRPLRRSDRDVIDGAIERVGLSTQKSRRFGDLSGGQRQRALLARAITCNPELLLLDEPFNGLDQYSRDALLDTIRSLTDDGVAVVLSTHDAELARNVCDRALLLGGRIIAEGSVDDLLSESHLTLGLSDGPHASPAGA